MGLGAESAETTSAASVWPRRWPTCSAILPSCASVTPRLSSSLGVAGGCLRVPFLGGGGLLPDLELLLVRFILKQRLTRGSMHVSGAVMLSNVAV